jgi:hypothetical protein
MDNFTKAYLDIINESSNEKQFVVMWYINGTSTEGIWKCIAHTKSEAEASFKKTLPRRKKYSDPKYNVSDVLIYELDEKTPESIDEITKEEIKERSWRWRNKTNKSSNEPIQGSCRGMFYKPVVKGLFGDYIKK